MALFDKLAKAANQFTGSAVPKTIINRFIEDYGKVVDLDIDNKSKTITATILLNGDSDPIRVRIDEYEVIKAGSSSSIVVGDASSDRAWVDALLKNCVTGKSWKIPEMAAAGLDAVLG